MDALFTGQPVYNEIDAYACAWLRTLCSAGYLRGRVIEGDVRGLDPASIAGCRRFHAFAGIGTWEYALQLAGWPDELPVWTGSCPCQPFSIAGRKRGATDERHLWPAWFRLVRECRPPIIFGEQVASPDGLGWFDAVSADLEGAGYAVGAADLCAASVGAPHIRQRLFFVAYRPVLGRHERRALDRWGLLGTSTQGSRERLADDGSLDDVANVPSKRRRGRPSHQALPAEVAAEPGRYGDAVTGNPGFWSNIEWIRCRDGKARPTQPGLLPLAHGLAGRMALVRTREQAGVEIQETHWYNRSGALKCLGNAIVPQLAAVFAEGALRSIHAEFV